MTKKVCRWEPALDRSLAQLNAWSWQSSVRTMFISIHYSNIVTISRANQTAAVKLQRDTSGVDLGGIHKRGAVKQK